MTVAVIEREFTVLEPKEVINKYIKLNKSCLKTGKEIYSMSSVSLLDYQTFLTRTVCETKCGVLEYLKDLKEHSKSLPENSMCTTEKYKFCMENCPIGKEFRLIGKVYESRGRKRPVRDAMTDCRKQNIAKSTEALLKNDITLKLPKARGR